MRKSRSRRFSFSMEQAIKDKCARFVRGKYTVWVTFREQLKECVKSHNGYVFDEIDLKQKRGRIITHHYFKENGENHEGYLINEKRD